MKHSIYLGVVLMACIAFFGVFDLNAASVGESEPENNDALEEAKNRIRAKYGIDEGEHMPKWALSDEERNELSGKVKNGLQEIPEDANSDVVDALRILNERSLGNMKVRWAPKGGRPKAISNAFKDTSSKTIVDSLANLFSKHGSELNSILDLEWDSDLIQEGIREMYNEDIGLEVASAKYSRMVNGFILPGDYIRVSIIKNPLTDEYQVSTISMKITAIRGTNYLEDVVCDREDYINDLRNSWGHEDIDLGYVSEYPQMLFSRKYDIHYIGWSTSIFDKKEEQHYEVQYDSSECLVLNIEDADGVNVDYPNGYIDTGEVYSFDERDEVTMDFRYGTICYHDGNANEDYCYDDLNKDGYYSDPYMPLGVTAYVRLLSGTTVAVPVCEYGNVDCEDTNTDVIYSIGTFTSQHEGNHQFLTHTGWDRRSNNLFQQVNYMLETLEGETELEDSLPELKLQYRMWDIAAAHEALCSSYIPTILIKCNDDTCREMTDDTAERHEFGHSLFCMRVENWTNGFDDITEGQFIYNAYNESMAYVMQSIIGRRHQGRHCTDQNYDFTSPNDILIYNGFGAGLDDVGVGVIHGCNGDAVHNGGDVWAQMYNRLNSDIGWKATFPLVFNENIHGTDPENEHTGIYEGADSILKTIFDSMEDIYVDRATRLFYEVTKYFKEHNPNWGFTNNIPPDDLSDRKFNAHMINAIGTSENIAYEESPDGWDTELRISERTDDTKYDIDYVSMYALDGEEYYIRAFENHAGLDLEMTHYVGESSTGTDYDDECSYLNPCFYFTASGSGWHFFEIYDSNNPDAAINHYKINIRTEDDDFGDTRATAFPIPRDYADYGDPLETYTAAEINDEDDVDWFKVHTRSSAPSRLNIYVDNVDPGLDIQIGLYESDGSLVGYTINANGDGGSETVSTSSATADEWYFIKVEGAYGNDGTGGYEIAAQNWNIGTPNYIIYSDLDDNFDPFEDSVYLDGFVTTTIDDDQDEDIYRFKVKEGVHVTIDTISVGYPKIDTRIRISMVEDGEATENFFNLNDGGGFDEGGSHIHIAAPTHAYQDGYMYVHVYPKTANDIGTYTLAIRKGSDANRLTPIPDVDE